MRTLILAGSITVLFGWAAVAQEGGTGSNAGDFDGASAMSMGAGLGLAKDMTLVTGRAYVLPPEADVEVTGSIGPRNCVGDTISRRMCQDTMDETTR